MKYIGVRRPSPKTRGNLNTIWTKGKDGKYRCPGYDIALSQYQIDSDLRNGYLKPL